MLKKFFIATNFLLLFVFCATASAAHTPSSSDVRWATFSYSDGNSGTCGEPPDSFQLIEDGFKCTTKTSRWVMINGIERQARLYINWEFKFSEDNITYTNNYDGNDAAFEKNLAEAILEFVVSELSRFY